MTPDEVRMLDNNYALLFIRGERPIMDLKFNTLKHTNFKLTEDGGYKAYIHGDTKNSIATVSVNANIDISDIKVKQYENTINYEVLIDEEIDNYMKK